MPKTAKRINWIANLQAQLDYLKTRLLAPPVRSGMNSSRDKLDLFHLQTEDEPEPVPP
ncbi:MAG: hypothetical protein ACLTC8_01850 [Lachnospiraceae bacterium]